jgi:hypothetical protein
MHDPDTNPLNMVQLTTEQRTIVIKTLYETNTLQQASLLLDWLTCIINVFSIPNGGRM